MRCAVHDSLRSSEVPMGLYETRGLQLQPTGLCMFLFVMMFMFVCLLATKRAQVAHAQPSLRVDLKRWTKSEAPNLRKELLPSSCVALVQRMETSQTCNKKHAIPKHQLQKDTCSLNGKLAANKYPVRSAIKIYGG